MFVPAGAVRPHPQPTEPSVRRLQMCTAPTAERTCRNTVATDPAFDGSGAHGVSGRGVSGRFPTALLPVGASDPMASGGRRRRLHVGGGEAVGAAGETCFSVGATGIDGGVVVVVVVVVGVGLVVSGAFSPVPQALSPTIPTIAAEAAAAARRRADRRDLMISPNCAPRAVWKQHPIGLLANSNPVCPGADVNCGFWPPQYSHLHECEVSGRDPRASGNC